MTKKITIAEAMTVIVKAIEEDSGYRESWKANIAVMFQDEFAKVDIPLDENILTSPLYKVLNEGSTVHTISNAAADNFLDMLVDMRKEDE